jgi:hypothetical protein
MSDRGIGGYRGDKPTVGYRHSNFTVARIDNRRAFRHHPDWRILFVLPLGFTVSPGPVPALTGTSIIAAGNLMLGQVTGNCKRSAMAQAEALADHIGYSHRPLMAHVSRVTEPRPYLFEPFQRGDEGVEELMHGHVVSGGTMRPYFHAGAEAARVFGR